MRAFRNVSKGVHYSLKLVYAALENKTNGNIESWQCVAITVFDHWLTREEFEQYFTNRSLDQQIDIDLRWQSFYSFLAKGVMCYQYKYRSVGRLIFKEPRNSSLFVRRLSRSSVAGTLQLVIPENTMQLSCKTMTTHVGCILSVDRL